MSADNCLPWSGENYRDPREERLSASSIDHAYRLLSTSPVIRQMYRANALPKWHGAEFYAEAIQDLSLTLLCKFSASTDGFLSFFNGSYFNYWLIRYFQNTHRSASSKFARRWREHGDLDEMFEEPQSHDRPFDVVPQMRNVRLWDFDVIRWRLLGSPIFSGFTSSQKETYLTYLQESATMGKKVKLRPFAERHGIPYDIVLRLVVKINRMMIDRIRELEKLDQ
jgi:hypothetical protein